MKILHVISSAGLYGAENVLLDLSDLLKKNGHNPSLICLKNMSKPDPQVHFEAKARGLESTIISCQSRFDLKALGRIKDLLRQEAIEIVHTHGYKSDFYGLIASKMAKVPVVTTLHGWTGHNKMVRFYEKLDLWMVKKMNHIVSASPAIVEHLKISGLDGKASFVPNAVDTEKFAPDKGKRDLRNEFNLGDALVVGTVGRLSIEKGHIYLVKAFKEIRSAIPSIKLLIVGKGNLRQDLENEAKKLGIEKDVVFAGPQKDIPSAYGSMDIFVLPSLTEGLPLVLLEAMAMGLPVVATKVGGVPYVIDGKEGILVPPGNIEELKDAIISMARDANLRRSSGEEGRRKVLSVFSLEVFYQKYINVYKSVLNGQRHE